MKVAIVGFGVEGQSSYNYFKKQGADITIVDESAAPKFTPPEGVHLIAGDGALDALQDFDVVMRVPAMNPSKIRTNGRVSSNVKEFFEQCPSKNIVGVTAAKGKGTMCSLVYEIAQAAGRRVHLAGNIGVPALDVLPDVQPDDIVVLELSSFQLWDMKQSPHIAIVGMIEPEHLEIHDGFKDYLDAKANIARWQMPDDILVYHPTNEHSKYIADTSSAAVKIPYNTQEGAYIDIADGERVLMIHGKQICKASEVQLPGIHNLENICAAVTAAWQFTQDVAAIRKAVTSFKGLPHRMQFVEKKHGVSYYDDSISTTPGSVIAVLHAFDPAKTTLIIGGQYDKGVDFSGLADEIARLQPHKVFFVGPIGEAIASLARTAGYEGEILNQWAMAEVVMAAAATAAKDGIVVLSPACASFGDFKDYKDRGNQFISAVKAL